MRRFATLAVVVAAAALLVAGCMNGGILRAPAPSRAPTVTPVPTPAVPADPQPIVFPRDEGPHGRLTEWWYYTGHLEGADGREFGFEFVIFRAERGDLPVAWASHLALTDAAGGRFLFDQRGEAGPQVDGSPPDGGFALAIGGDPAAGDPPAIGATAWTMAGRVGRDRLSAWTDAFALELSLATDRPPVLHGGIGWIDFGATGGSYYYSRTRMSVEGTLALAAEAAPLDVTGEAWFDHQWGDFMAVGGGWDWFSVQLADGADLTISLVRAPSGETALAYGTLVAPDGTYRHLTADAFAVEATGSWRSPRSGADYPSGWRVAVPGAGLDLRLDPLLADQELDTRATTGVVYWEGAVRVSGTSRGVPVAGRGYVELTGYARPAPPAP